MLSVSLDDSALNQYTVENNQINSCIYKPWQLKKKKIQMQGLFFLKHCSLFSEL